MDVVTRLLAVVCHANARVVSAAVPAERADVQSQGFAALVDEWCEAGAADGYEGTERKIEGDGTGASLSDCLHTGWYGTRTRCRVLPLNVTYSRIETSRVPCPREFDRVGCAA